MIGAADLLSGGTMPERPGGSASGPDGGGNATPDAGDATTAMPVPPPPQRTALEGFTKCSESLLWKLMMSFYNKKGVES